MNRKCLFGTPGGFDLDSEISRALVSNPRPGELLLQFLPVPLAAKMYGRGKSTFPSLSVLSYSARAWVTLRLCQIEPYKGARIVLLCLGSHIINQFFGFNLPCANLTSLKIELVEYELVNQHDQAGLAGYELVKQLVLVACLSW